MAHIVHTFNRIYTWLDLIAPGYRSFFCLLPSISISLFISHSMTLCDWKSAFVPANAFQSPSINFKSNYPNIHKSVFILLAVALNWISKVILITWIAKFSWLKYRFWKWIGTWNPRSKPGKNWKNIAPARTHFEWVRKVLIKISNCMYVNLRISYLIQDNLRP